MMRTTKILFASLFAVSIFSSCSDSNTTTTTATTEITSAELANAKTPADLLAGKWNIDNMTTVGEEPLTGEDLEEMRKGSWWEFSKDGKLSSKFGGEDFLTGTWELSDDGKKLTIASRDEEGLGLDELVVEKLDENNLVMTLKDEAGDIKWVCKK